jgi:hypothetical protein
MKKPSITLDEPIQRDKQTIESISIRKPKSGELRGINLADLLQMNTDAIMKVTPRVSEPTITIQEAEALEPADLLKIGAAIANFLLPKEAQSSLQ